VVGIATRLGAGLSEVQISAEPKDLSLLQNVQTGVRGLPGLHFSDTGFFFLWVKRPARDAHYSPPSRVAVKNEWMCTSTPPTCASWPGQG
jgi:hypothetical protein